MFCTPTVSPFFCDFPITLNWISGSIGALSSVFIFNFTLQKGHVEHVSEGKLVPVFN
jgi:hypothetical protein